MTWFGYRLSMRFSRLLNSKSGIGGKAAVCIAAAGAIGCLPYQPGALIDGAPHSTSANVAGCLDVRVSTENVNRQRVALRFDIGNACRRELPVHFQRIAVLATWNGQLQRLSLHDPNGEIFAAKHLDGHRAASEILAFHYPAGTSAPPEQWCVDVSGLVDGGDVEAMCVPLGRFRDMS